MEFPLVFLRIWSKGVQKRGLGIGEGLAFNLCMVGPQVDGGVGGGEHFTYSVQPGSL